MTITREQLRMQSYAAITMQEKILDDTERVFLNALNEYIRRLPPEERELAKTVGSNISQTLFDREYSGELQRAILAQLALTFVKTWQADTSAAIHQMHKDDAEAAGVEVTEH